MHSLLARRRSALVIKPDLYEPELNPVYAAMLEHYEVVADPARVRDPDRKGTVEHAIGHTQATALIHADDASTDPGHGALTQEHALIRDTQEYGSLFSLAANQAGTSTPASMGGGQ